ncbi:hypothetical protein E1301_Tti016807 [Triplophysa tibetana]|uniref:Uncharacterized protein n=1 Tax=Triplophysa tibetana TaxID=1572043 RepID=A0A5A9PFM9_9TELE|nr:hypothetical protein E1301_Tti016807 [Triplophysa tibetana]
MKNTLPEPVEKQFATIEEETLYEVASLLDPRFKDSERRKPCFNSRASRTAKKNAAKGFCATCQVLKCPSRSKREEESQRLSSNERTGRFTKNHRPFYSESCGGSREQTRTRKRCLTRQT